VVPSSLVHHGTGHQPIEALTHNAVLHHSKEFVDEAMEALVDEATRLVTAYLLG